jgi:hypothetical protein
VPISNTCSPILYFFSHSYRDFVKDEAKRKGHQTFDSTAEFCVQDFFHLNENVAKDIKNVKFVIYCQFSHAILLSD